MMRAYDQNLLNKARGSLAGMFEYAVNGYGLALEEFYLQFLRSSLAGDFAAGDSSVLAGMSGVEMAYRVILENDAGAVLAKPVFQVNKSPEYWLGWALAYYQWYRNLSFDRITENVGVNDVLLMYPKYHEMDIMHFVEALDEMRAAVYPESALKRFRMYAGLSQKQLAEKTDIPVRTIQQYEQRQKNINHAQADYVIRMAHALYCRPEDLLE